MKAREIKDKILGGALREYSALYTDLDFQANRIIAAIDTFTQMYGEDREISVFSVPGRSEISGNHTDHNNGCVLAGSIDRDVIAVASPREDGIIRLYSDGYSEEQISLSDVDEPKNFKSFTSASLIAGVCRGFKNEGYAVGGYDAYLTSAVPEGSGISSSAAYEVMLGNLLNHLYNGGAIDNQQLAVIAKYAENVYFGKPCGLMDQMACAVGGFVYIDFENGDSPRVEPIKFSLTDAGYSLCIVNAGASHADLNDDYAAVPGEMRAVAKLLGREVLRGLTEEDIIKNLTNIRRCVGDRAVLRSIHFIRENERVEKIREALLSGDVAGFLGGVNKSGRSSFEYLQNVYSPKNPGEQSVALALAITDGYLEGKAAAFRVHGGGFAGTIQVFLPVADTDGYVDYMNSVFGDGAAEAFRIRPLGATKLF
ncbi:MAG: galactokinase [Clostridia bacterium]|nr:galactokinase [Clostridia bacterium]